MHNLYHTTLCSNPSQSLSPSSLRLLAAAIERAYIEGFTLARLLLFAKTGSAKSVTQSVIVAFAQQWTPPVVALTQQWTPPVAWEKVPA